MLFPIDPANYPNADLNEAVSQLIETSQDGDFSFIQKLLDVAQGGYEFPTSPSTSGHIPVDLMRTLDHAECPSEHELNFGGIGVDTPVEHKSTLPEIHVDASKPVADGYRVRRQTDPGAVTALGGNSLLSDGNSSNLSNQAQLQPQLTTVILRNIPNKYSVAMLRAALSEFGNFNCETDVCNLYLTEDRISACNRGYAFIDFANHQLAVRFISLFDGLRLPSHGSMKVCKVEWARRQGIPSQDHHHPNNHHNNNHGSFNHSSGGTKNHHQHHGGNSHQGGLRSAAHHHGQPPTLAAAASNHSRIGGGRFGAQAVGMNHHHGAIVTASTANALLPTPHGLAPSLFRSVDTTDNSYYGTAGNGSSGAANTDGSNAGGNASQQSAAAQFGGCIWLGARGANTTNSFTNGGAGSSSWPESSSTLGGNGVGSNGKAGSSNSLSCSIYHSMSFSSTDCETLLDGSNNSGNGGLHGFMMK